MRLAICPAPYGNLLRQQHHAQVVLVAILILHHDNAVFLAPVSTDVILVFAPKWVLVISKRTQKKSTVGNLDIDSVDGAVLRIGPNGRWNQ